VFSVRKDSNNKQKKPLKAIKSHEMVLSSGRLSLFAGDFFAMFLKAGSASLN
jgi:hypothetical protein